MDHHKAFIIYLFIYFLFFYRLIFNGFIIAPHNNGLETASTKEAFDSYLSNRYLSDQIRAHIPEVNQHLNDNNSSWISTWNPYTALGRPVFQFSGFGKAYLLTHIISFFTENPFVYFKIYTLLTIFLTGTFLFLFLKSCNLSPLASLISTVGMVFTPYSIFWINHNHSRKLRPLRAERN